MKIFITRKAETELDKIPDELAKNISRKILSLTVNPFPSNCKKLQGHDNYRLRVGDFRIIYTVDMKKNELTILRVANRKTVYR